MAIDLWTGELDMTILPDGELERAALVIDPYHMGERKARKYVDELAIRLGIKVPQGSAYSQDVLFQFEGTMLKLNFQSLVDETRKTGVPRDLQDILDLRDPFLSPVTQHFAVGVLPGNLISSYKVTYGEYTKTVELPGSAEAPNESLANDILAYRAAVSAREFSNDWLRGVCSVLSCLSSVMRFPRGLLHFPLFV